MSLGSSLFLVMRNGAEHHQVPKFQLRRQLRLPSWFHITLSKEGNLPSVNGKLPSVNLPSTEGNLHSVEGKLTEGNLPAVEGILPSVQGKLPSVNLSFCRG